MDNLPVLVLSDQKNDVLYAKLAEKSPDRLERAKAQVAELDFSRTQSVLAFGASDQKGLVDFTDSVLTNIRSADAGPVGMLMANLKGKILDLDVRSLPTSTGGKLSNIAANIPIIGSWLAAKVDEARAFIRRYEVLKLQIDDITEKLEAERTNQIEHLNRLDTLYERNEEYFDALEITIAAGELKLVEMEQQFEQQRQALAGQNTVDAKELQSLKDFGDTIQSLDRRLYNLKLARASAITSGPTIRVAQEGSKAIVEMIQESILMMIPEWKKQLVIAISLFDQKRAMAMVNETRDMTNNLMMSTADMLGQTQTTVKKAQGEGFVKIETLQKMTDKLVQTIDQGIQMDTQNKQKRAEGIQKLAQAEEKLKEALKAANESVLS
ncbi:MAG: toxic anion resistance protein [Candidatus Electrothrix aestuarii]|uniref:Toxic anion resistance protein n=1 Tax=Candidatus Electrothrix aestuarii TaxID=3062594 RepID=A0AAU8M0C0_9BACT|nr:toxic anion resistance protein [Candidatus Electrothrix aestuarii]